MAPIRIGIVGSGVARVVIAHAVVRTAALVLVDERRVPRLLARELARGHAEGDERPDAALERRF